jgi:hypothetical protein
MKKCVLIVLLFVIGLSVPIFLLYLAPVSQAESAVIAGERNRLMESRDRKRMENDPLYARATEMKLQHLEYLLARAYNEENMPDAAISLLQKLIADEEAKNKGLDRRRSRSCREEARYYEVLQQACARKQDKAEEEKADQHRGELIAKAITAEKREEMEEGRSLRMVED